MANPLCPIAVVAYNEEKNIIRCLDSLYEAAPGMDLQIDVLANGCTDNTEKAVAEYAKAHREVRLHSIKFGDRTNAWNVYVHEIAPPAEIYVFVDGDCRIGRNAVSALHFILKNDPYSTAAAGIPMSGRNRDYYLKQMFKLHLLMGNLYALRGSFIERLRAKGIKMPAGWRGDDALLGALVKFDLNLQKDRVWDDNRVIVCREAGFYFDSFSPMCLEDWKRYYGRRVMYSIRDINTQLIQSAFKRYGFLELPDNVAEFYRKYYDLYRFRYAGLDTIFRWLANRKIRRICVPRIDGTENRKQA